jgi:predicted nucleic acid-binding protein
MGGFLLDTCVISESTRARPTPKVIRWLDARAPESLFLSVVSVTELEQGIARVDSSVQARKLETWLSESVLPQFESRVLDVDVPVARRWGRLLGSGKRRGEPPPIVDALLAATAIVHELTLVTRNVADFDRFDLHLLNPWQ